MEILCDALHWIHHHHQQQQSAGVLEQDHLQLLVTHLENLEEDEYRPLTTNRNASHVQFVDPALDAISDIAKELIYWNPNLCHTARLPSDIRSRGLLLVESELPRGDRYDDDDDEKIYDNQGVDLAQVRWTKNTRMPLTSDRGQYLENCHDVRTRIDYEDFFVVNSVDWSRYIASPESIGEISLPGYYHCPNSLEGIHCNLPGVVSRLALWQRSRQFTASHKRQQQSSREESPQQQQK